MNDSVQQQFAEIARLVREQEIGRHTRIDTPFGRRLITYADLTATGRYLRFVENWMHQVRPFYANTHTEVSSTGRLMTELRESARSIIRRAINAADDDVVLFVGSGATAAVNKLVGLLGLTIPEPLERAHDLVRRIPGAARPVVFVGPYEHHSNILPWVESIAEVVEIPLDRAGGLDLGRLESVLVEHAGRPFKIGSFSAASNVTGLLTDVRAVARLLHRHGALAFFDYAAAAPYVPIDVRPADPEERIDALFLSTHKFAGGPECSGVLVARRSLFRSATPERPGGGTVSYVLSADRAGVDYVAQLEEREEGGTPQIMGDLRAGAAFLVKEMLGPQAILEHETALAASAVARLSRHPRIRVLGPPDLPRLGIVAFTVEGLHHDFVSALLDHLFGVQNRPGCACAGPYGHHLLDVSRATSTRYRELIRRGIEGVKPGWSRISLPYYASDEDIEFILSAVEFVADHGAEFLPLYRMHWMDGVWRFEGRTVPAAPHVRLTAEALELAARGPDPQPPPALTEAQLARERSGYLDEARRLAGALRERWIAEPPRWNPPTGDPAVDALVWFRYVHADGLER